MMATTHVVHHHESHGNHPMSVVAFCCTIAGIACAGLWLVALAGGNAVSVGFGIAALVLFVCAITAFPHGRQTRTPRSVRPENTEIETHRYLDEYRGG